MFQRIFHVYIRVPSNSTELRFNNRRAFITLFLNILELSNMSGAVLRISTEGLTSYKLLLHTVCPRSLDPFHILSYYIKWAKTSCTYSIIWVIEECDYMYMSEDILRGQYPCTPPSLSHWKCQHVTQRAHFLKLILRSHILRLASF